MLFLFYVVLSWFFMVFYTVFLMFSYFFWGVGVKV